MKMFNKHVTKLLSAYCDGELSPEQSRRVAEHLLVCDRCRNEHDEIGLGVQMAKQLPPALAPAEMWSEIEALLDNQSRKPILTPRAPTEFAFGWYRVAAFSAVLLVALALGVVLVRRSHDRPPGESWEVASLSGTIRIDRGRATHKGRLAIGGTLETDGSSSAKISVAEIGEVEVDPNSRIRLVETRSTEHRLALDHGRIHAKISAPPRLFFVDTPSAEAIDLGCAYTLEVDDLGRSFLHVTSGWVELVRDGRESYVPIGAMCQTRPGIGPGTPYFADATGAFAKALEKFDFENGGEEAFNAVVNDSRPRDSFTLWHLLSRVEAEQRSRVLERMIKLVGLPNGVTREGVMQLNQKMLDTWKDELDTVWF
jgi:Putative zinc-finger/FecR protein